MARFRTRVIPPTTKRGRAEGGRDLGAYGATSLRVAWALGTCAPPQTRSRTLTHPQSHGPATVTADTTAADVDVAAAASQGAAADELDEMVRRNIEDVVQAANIDADGAGPFLGGADGLGDGEGHLRVCDERADGWASGTARAALHFQPLCRTLLGRRGRAGGEERESGGKKQIRRETGRGRSHTAVVLCSQRRSWHRICACGGARRRSAQLPTRRQRRGGHSACTREGQRAAASGGMRLHERATAGPAVAAPCLNAAGLIEGGGGQRLGRPASGTR
eukprot:170242-Chlamydomonas_euryale.AAC.4